MHEADIGDGRRWIHCGSHVCLELQRTGYEVVALDNLANSSPVSLQRVALLSNKPVELVVGDVRDASCLDRIFMIIASTALFIWLG